MPARTNTTRWAPSSARSHGASARSPLVRSGHELGAIGDTRLFKAAMAPPASRVGRYSDSSVSAGSRRRAPRLLRLSGRRALVVRPVRRRRQASAQQRRRRLRSRSASSGYRRPATSIVVGGGSWARRRTPARDAPRKWSRTTGCGVPDGVVATLSKAARDRPSDRAGGPAAQAELARRLVRPRPPGGEGTRWSRATSHMNERQIRRRRRGRRPA